MEIDQFVSVVLNGIAKGIEQSSKAKGLVISPATYLKESDNMAGDYIVSVRGNKPIMMVKFDLSVVVRSEIQGETGGKVSLVGVVGAEGKTSGAWNETAVQRVTFEVPVAFWPTGE